MISQFNIVFSINVFHDYFEGEKCDCLDFRPIKSTSEIMKRFGFIIKRSKNGFALYTTNTRNIQEYLNYIEKTIQQNYLEFEIDTNNDNFNYFTEIPMNWLGQLQYSSTNIVKNNNDKLQLEPVFISQSCNTTIGTVQIYFQDLRGLINNNCNSNYEIYFQARATQWQYYIINTSGLLFNNLTIVSKTSIDFGKSTPVIIQSGKTALLFSSGEQYIKMSEVPKYQFDLVNESKTTNQTLKTNSLKTIFKGLPNPNPSHIGTTITQGTSIATSPMYVYI
jgi:hypothetical protein